MFDDDLDDDDPDDLAPFVGRNDEREAIKMMLGHSVRAVQLVGSPMVGKSCLAEKISRELQQEMAAKDRKLMCYHMSCMDVLTADDFLARLSAGLELPSTATSYSSLVNSFKKIAKDDPKCSHFFVLLKCESFHRIGLDIQFLDLVKKLMETSNRAFAIITTQKAFNFPPARQVPINPLSSQDTVTLVKRCAPDVDIDPYRDAIEKHCMGLPPLAMDAAHQLVKAQGIPLSPYEFEEVLSGANRSRRIHTSHDVLNSAALRQFQGLNDFLKQRILDISIFKGSFRVDHILKLLGQNQAEAKAQLIEMRNSGVVELEHGGQRMHLQTVISHYVRNIMGNHIKYSDTVRLQFVTLFLDVLKKADSELFVKPQQTVFGYLHDDWPNLRQVLEQAIHCTENTYPAFLQVAMNAENLLVKCFPGEAVKFYEAMMWSATRFGNPEECAMQKWLLGMAKTLSKGTDLVEAMGLFKEALPVLRSGNTPEALVSVMADMGLNYCRQGKNTKSRNFYLEALEESGRCHDGRKLTNRIINIRCYLAIPMIFLEHYDEAETLLKETLAETEKVAPCHPSIPVMINSLGLIYERAGKDDDEALRYYTASLYERRKYADVAPGDLVVVLNNVAMQHSKRGNHDYALQLLSEARDIRMKLDRINYHTALTCWNMGQVYARKCDIENALVEVRDALEIFKKCTKSHFVIVEVLFLAAHLAAALGCYGDAEQYLKDAVDFEDKYREHLPTGGHTLMVLQHLLMIYLGWKRKSSPVLDRAVAEANRLAELSRNTESRDKHVLYLRQTSALYRVRASLDQQTVSKEMLDNVLTEMSGFCFVCEDLNSRNMDMVSVFRSMSTNVTGALASFDTLLRSEAMTTAVGLLKKASGRSESPPVSPTASDPPSFSFDRLHRKESSIASPFYYEQGNCQPLKEDGHSCRDLKSYMQPTQPPSSATDIRNAHTYQAPVETNPCCFTRPEHGSPCSINHEFPIGQMHQDSLVGYVHERGDSRQDKSSGSLGVDITILNRDTCCDDSMERMNQAAASKREKIKEADDAFRGALPKTNDRCSLDPSLRYPPSFKFPTLDQRNIKDSNPGSELPPWTISQHNTVDETLKTIRPQSHFHDRYKEAITLLQNSVIAEKENVPREATPMVTPGNVFNMGAGNLYGGTACQRVQKRTASSPCSSSSGVCSRSASEHDERRHENTAHCTQPGCLCSLKHFK
ncbi:uncharacterized protein LOC124258382 isoform X2 [Haliotis rubra]|uniref:uncharacterized protein LOC124258382 isoform X2 n=1 Tax=Haliotis rubra TaxID=36100 RepID=UPI001EE519F7|nr:uncharacterized protein LOC124258382 isoform X2 [Haliotis rubra]